MMKTLESITKFELWLIWCNIIVYVLLFIHYKRLRIIFVWGWSTKCIIFLELNWNNIGRVAVWCWKKNKSITNKNCYYFNDTNRLPNKLPRIFLIITMPSPPPTPPPTPPPSPPPTPPPKPDPPYVLVIRYLLNILFSKWNKRNTFKIYKNPFLKFI